MKTPQELLRDLGYPSDTPSKVLPDGRIAWVHRLIYTHAILVAPVTSIHLTYQDRWCYLNKAAAERALNEWTTQPEPSGWIRHPQTGRRRPDGTPAKEYINL